MAKLVSTQSMQRYARPMSLVAFFGGTLGAAGWIFGIAFELMGAPQKPAGVELDIQVVLLCAAGVVLFGFFLGCLSLAGLRLSTFLIWQTLMGASFIFGTAAIMWLQSRGVLTLAVRGYAFKGQPGNEIWEAIGRHVRPEFAYAAPALILGFMAAAWWPPLWRALLGIDTRDSRGAPESEPS
ncbi:MAG TPA: hypothetical protein VFG04_13605 [Planctomycetaceae bacterium]|jgi:hypothetical protein|nr:hypothetical protein [Planctomycetaceae bacterium]